MKGLEGKKMGNNEASFHLVLVESRKHHDPKAKVIEKCSAFATNLEVEEEEKREAGGGL